MSELDTYWIGDRQTRETDETKVIAEAKKAAKETRSPVQIYKQLYPTRGIFRWKIVAPDGTATDSK